MVSLGVRQGDTRTYSTRHRSVRAKHSLQMLDDPRCRLAVPFRWDRALFPLPCHQSREGRRQLARIGTNEFVRPDRDGLEPLGVISQGQARYAQYGRL